MPNIPLGFMEKEIKDIAFRTGMAGEKEILL